MGNFAPLFTPEQLLDEFKILDLTEDERAILRATILHAEQSDEVKDILRRRFREVYEKIRPPTSQGANP
jgi:hypothetical protein